MNALIQAADAQNAGAATAPGPMPSPAGADAEDIRDIRGPKAVPGSWLLPALLGGVLLLAVAALVIWRLRRRVNRARVLTLTEQTLLRLDAIRPLMLPATAREFGIEASEIVRTYIEKRFSVVATQRTTEEFLQGLLQDSHDSLTRHRPLLSDFLQQCDFVKFAGVSLTSRDMESLFQSARKFVLETSQPQTA
jgi:hypothetical protein